MMSAMIPRVLGRGRKAIGRSRYTASQHELAGRLLHVSRFARNVLEESVQELEIERVDRGTEHRITLAQRCDPLRPDLLFGHAPWRSGRRRPFRASDHN